MPVVVATTDITLIYCNKCLTDIICMISGGVQHPRENVDISKVLHSKALQYRFHISEAEEKYND